MPCRCSGPCCCPPVYGRSIKTSEEMELERAEQAVKMAERQLEHARKKLEQIRNRPVDDHEEGSYLILEPENPVSYPARAYRKGSRGWTSITGGGLPIGWPELLSMMQDEQYTPYQVESMVELDY